MNGNQKPNMTGSRRPEEMNFGIRCAHADHVWQRSLALVNFSMVWRCFLSGTVEPHFSGRRNLPSSQCTFRGARAIGNFATG
jgi:hypothetical protein